MTHCFWVNSEIFPLTTYPNVDLNCAEHWLSPLSIEDATKTELYLLICYSKFSSGVQFICSESVSDVKGSAGSIFGLRAKFFIHGYSRFNEPKCLELLCGANGKYIKFAQVLFPDPRNLHKDQFLKTASLVKVTLFGKSSVGKILVPLNSI
ncbi:hypothetical protein OG21DRAFT_1528354, partial [Imleria badia]